MACTDAVETEIDRHYGRAAGRAWRRVTPSWPPRSPISAPRSWSIATPRGSMAAQETIGYPLLTAAIRAGCRLAIGLSKRTYEEPGRRFARFNDERTPYDVEAVRSWAAAIGLAGLALSRRAGARPEHQGERDHRLRHRPLPALDRRRDRRLRPQAGKRALPDSRSAPPGRLAAVAPSLGGARQAFETVGRTGINSCSPVGPAGCTGCTEQVIHQAFTDREEAAAERKRPRRQ